MTGAGALLPPAATARYLNGEFAFGWVGLRLRAGPAGIPALQRELAGPENTLDRAFHLPAGAISLQHPPPGHRSPPGAAGHRAAGGRAGHLRRTGGAGPAGAGRAGPGAAAELVGGRCARHARGRRHAAPRSRSRPAWTGRPPSSAGWCWRWPAPSPYHRWHRSGRFARSTLPAVSEADPLVLAGGGGALAVLLLGVLAALAWRSVAPGGERAGQQDLVDRPARPRRPACR